MTDPGPTVSAVPALLPAAAPTPPPAAPADPMQLHPVQMGNGVLSAVLRLHRADIAYAMISATISGRRRMPILSAGEVDIPDKQPAVIIEFDVNEFFKDIKDEGQKHEEMKTAFHRWSNYYAYQIQRELQALVEMAHNAYVAFFQKEPPDLAIEIPDFDKAMQTIRAQSMQYEKPWTEFAKMVMAMEQSQQAPVPAIPVTIGGKEVPLAEILATAGVQDPTVIAATARTYMQTATSELAKGFEPCLAAISYGAKKALEICNQRVSRK